MPFYTFKRNCKVYIVANIDGTLKKYKLEIYPDLSFSQTFDEQAINVKTLHDQDAMFEGAVINRANPANFKFTILLKNSMDHITVGNLLTMENPLRDGSYEALYSSDLYIDTGVDIFKLEKAVFERGTYQIQRDALVTVSIQGTARKLSRFATTGTAIPGTVSSTTASVGAIIPRAVQVELDAVALANIAAVTLELTNNVEWLNYDTLHKSLNVIAPSDTMYPEAFVVSSKTLSGTIQQYLTDMNQSRANTWSTNSLLNIRVGDLGPTWFFEVEMPGVVFTNRLDMQEALYQVYDFRMVANPTSLTTVLNHNF